MILCEWLLWSKIFNAVLKPIADFQDKIGKGETELPAREMIADMLRIAGRDSEALPEYRQSLKVDPGRFNTLLHAGKWPNNLVCVKKPLDTIGC